MWNIWNVKRASPHLWNLETVIAQISSSVVFRQLQ